MPTNFGSLVLEGYVPETDATIVTRLLYTGADSLRNLKLSNTCFPFGSGSTY